MFEALVKKFLTALRALPESSFKLSSTPDSGFDAVLQGRVKGQPVRLFLQTRRAVYPRDAIVAAHQLRPAGHKAVPVVVAQSISPGAREVLRERRIGYWDEGGSLFLDVPGAMFLIDREAPTVDRRLGNVFRGSTAQVLHALLVHTRKAWHVDDLAKASDTSTYSVQQVCKWLEEQLWMEKQGKGPSTVRRLTEPGALLDAWAAQHSLDRYTFHRYFHLVRSSAGLYSDIEGVLGTLKVPHAWTLEAGAEQAAPASTSVQRVSILVSSEQVERISQATSASGLRPVADGENVVFLATSEKSPLMFRRQVDFIWVASDVQLYLDLWAWPRRGKELARHLRATRMEF